MPPERVVVVGGGMGGLVVARDLAQAGVAVTILEAGERLGGQVSRHTVGGIDLDAGAEAFATKSTAVGELAAELGLADDVVPPAPAAAWIYGSDGRASRLPATSLLGIPGHPLSRDVIAAVGLPSAVRAAMDLVLPAASGPADETLGHLVRRRLGRGVLDRLVAPVVTGVHSAPPGELATDRVAPGLRGAMTRHRSLVRGVRALRRAAPAGSAVCGIRGGISRLIDALEADLVRLGVEIRLGARASVDASGTARVDGHEVPGTVIVAAPNILGSSVMRTAVLVTLVVDAPALDTAPRGSGVLVASGAPRVRARALTHQTAKWPWLQEAAGDRHVLRLSYDEELRRHIETAMADAAVLLGVDLPAQCLLDSARVTWLRAAAAGPHGGMLAVGESVAGTGLAAVVAQARAQARALLEAAPGGVR